MFTPISLYHRLKEFEFLRKIYTALYTIPGTINKNTTMYFETHEKNI